MAVSSFTEPCDRCGRSTPHDVRIEIREETRPPKRVRYSREPYRITVCQRCGGQREQRMNAA